MSQSHETFRWNRKVLSLESCVIRFLALNMNMCAAAGRPLTRAAFGDTLIVESGHVRDLWLCGCVAVWPHIKMKMGQNKNDAPQTIITAAADQRNKMTRIK